MRDQLAQILSPKRCQTWAKRLKPCLRLSWGRKSAKCKNQWRSTLDWTWSLSTSTLTGCSYSSICRLEILIQSVSSLPSLSIIKVMMSSKGLRQLRMSWRDCGKARIQMIWRRRRDWLAGVAMGPLAAAYRRYECSSNVWCLQWGSTLAVLAGSRVRTKGQLGSVTLSETLTAKGEWSTFLSKPALV